MNLHIMVDSKCDYKSLVNPGWLKFQNYYYDLVVFCYSWFEKWIYEPLQTFEYVISFLDSKQFVALTCYVQVVNLMFVMSMASVLWRTLWNIMTIVLKSWGKNKRMLELKDYLVWPPFPRSRKASATVFLTGGYPTSPWKPPTEGSPLLHEVESAGAGQLLQLGHSS